MIRKFTACLFVCLTVLLFSRCNDDEVSAPPKPTVKVDKTTGLTGDTEFTFTIDQVDAKSISILPYGEAHPSWGGIQIAKSSFTGGKATVTFKYDQVGSFQAVAVATNFSDDGESVKKTLSDPVTITISSDKKSISDFSFSTSTATSIDEEDGTISVTVPYGTDITKLKASFTASAFTTVKIGSATQTSGTTENNFSSPVVYTVTATDGSTKTYTVTVNVTPIEQNDEIKTITAKSTAKSNKDRAFQVAIDNDERTIFVYDEFGTAASAFDSVALKYELAGKFANMSLNGQKLAQDAVFNLTSPKTVVVAPQDSVDMGKVTYTLYAAAAPKLTLAMETLNPQVTAVRSGFGYTFTVLNGTTLTGIPVKYTIDVTGLNVTVTQFRIIYNSGTVQVFTPSGSGTHTFLDLTKAATIQLTVENNSTGVTYVATYSVLAVAIK